MKFNVKLLEGNNSGKLLEVNQTPDPPIYSHLIQEKIHPEGCKFPQPREK